MRRSPKPSGQELPALRHPSRLSRRADGSRQPRRAQPVRRSPKPGDQDVPAQRDSRAHGCGAPACAEHRGKPRMGRMNRMPSIASRGPLCFATVLPHGPRRPIQAGVVDPGAGRRASPASSDPSDPSVALPGLVCWGGVGVWPVCGVSAPCDEAQSQAVRNCPPYGGSRAAAVGLTVPGSHDGRSPCAEAPSQAVRDCPPYGAVAPRSVACQPWPVSQTIATACEPPSAETSHGWVGWIGCRAPRPADRCVLRPFCLTVRGDPSKRGSSTPVQDAERLLLHPIHPIHPWLRSVSSAGVRRVFYDFRGLLCRLRDPAQAKPRTVRLLGTFAQRSAAQGGSVVPPQPRDAPSAFRRGVMR